MMPFYPARVRLTFAQEEQQDNSGIRSSLIHFALRRVLDHRYPCREIFDSLSHRFFRPINRETVRLISILLFVEKYPCQLISLGFAPFTSIRNIVPYDNNYIGEYKGKIDLLHATSNGAGICRR